MSPLKKIRFKTDLSHADRRLDQLLAEVLPVHIRQPVSKGKVRKLIVAGAVYLNGQRVRIASKGIRPGVWVDVMIDIQRLLSDSTAQDRTFIMTPDRILFEDEYIIVVDKPAGLPTQPTLDEARVNLFASLRQFLAKRAGVPEGQVYLALHHRLDRDTSGVIVFAKSDLANPGLADAFSTRKAEKIYHALVGRTEGYPSANGLKTHWTVRNFLARKNSSGKSARYGAVRSGGDPAETVFQVLENLNSADYVEARPHTGRTHQIRVHLAEGGSPILGDTNYGGLVSVAGVSIPRLMLHAKSLALPHPFHQTLLTFHSEIPKDFAKCLELLRHH